MNADQLVILAVVVVSLLAAFYAFYKTPKNKRYKIFTPDIHRHDPAYAPEYTKKERISFLLKALPISLFIYVISVLFFDWIGCFSQHYGCVYFGPVTGGSLLIYGAFIGAPLVSAVVLFLFEGRRAMKIIRIGQYPLPGQKVYRPTKYKYGYKAKAHGTIILAFIFFLVCVSVWGGGQAQNIVSDTDACKEL